MKNEKPNIADPQNCLCFNLRRATRLITRTYDTALAPAGVTSAQFSALTILSGMGPMTVGAFASAMEVERTTLTRNLNLLEKDGLVVRKQGDDQRARVVSITRAGEKQLKVATPHWRAVQKQVAALLGERGASGVLRNAGAIEQALAQAP